MKRELAAAVILGWTFTLAAGELTVAPDGLTPSAAIERIRAAKKAGDRSPWTVTVKGFNPISETLVLRPEDSGSADAPVRWIGEDGATIAGGTMLTGWTDAGKGTWECPAPRDRDGKVVWFEQLWVNGRRAPRSVWPKKGFLNFKTAMQEPQVEGRTTNYLERTTFVQAVPLETLSAEELPYAQMLVRVKWSFSRRNLRSYDAARHELRTLGSTPWPSWKAWSEKHDLALVNLENVRFGFTDPGDWFYDRAAGKVLYRPLPGERIETLKALAPTANLDRLMVLAGDADAARHVRWIEFKGVSFAAAAAHDEFGAGDGRTENEAYQAAVNTCGAIELKAARNVRFEDCAVRHTGGYGLTILDGSMSNAVARCALEDLGAGGIRAGRTGYNYDVTLIRGDLYSRLSPRDDSLKCPVVHDYSPRAVAFIDIEDTVIRGGGRFNPEGIGVLFQHISDSKIIHCEISDNMYSGISVGWVWGYRGSPSQRNEIAYNRIWDLGKGVMSDMGGIYTLGTSHGTRIHHNVIHGVDAKYYGGWGLYNDEGSEGILMDCNLVYDTFDASYHQHYGRNNIVRNNIFAFSRDGQIGVSAAENHLSVHFDRNIIYFNGAGNVFHKTRYFGTRDASARIIWTSNFWWNERGRVEFDHYRDFARWKLDGNDLEGGVVNPGFVDPAHRDFRLKPDSAVVKRGFIPFDPAEAGVRRK